MPSHSLPFTVSFPHVSLSLFLPGPSWTISSVTSHFPLSYNRKSNILLHTLHLSIQFTWPHYCNCLYLVHLITNFYLNVSSKCLFLILSIITVASVLFNCRICWVYMMKSHSEIFVCTDRIQNSILMNCSIKSGYNQELRCFTKKLLVWVVSNISRSLLHFVNYSEATKASPMGHTSPHLPQWWYPFFSSIFPYVCLQFCSHSVHINTGSENHMAETGHRYQEA